MLDLLEGVAILVGQQPGLPLDGESESTLGQVVRPPLDEHRRELVGHHRSQKRKVLIHQLFLQTDGVRAHHDLLLAMGQKLGDRREKVGETLAGSGTRLDEEPLVSGEGPFHRGRHLDLLGSRLEAGKPTGDRTAFGQEI